MQGDEFLKEYLRVVRDIGRQQKDLFWWATDTASKNRFLTELPEILYSSRKAGVADRLGEAVARIGRVFYHAGRSLGRAWMARRVLGHSIAGKMQPGAQYVIRSIVYDSSFQQDGSYQDVFFGPLVPFIQARMPLLIVADVMGDYKKILHQMKMCADLNVVPWEYYLSFWDVVKYSWKLLWWRPSAISGISFNGRDVSEAVNRYLAVKGSKIQPLQLFYYPAVSRLCQMARIERFLLSYEANPWEKMCILALRRYAGSAKIYGFQHSIIPQASANMFIAEGEVDSSPLPDRILTVGDEPRRILEILGAYPEGFLRTGCALRMPHIFEKPFSRQKDRTLLVAMEGLDGVSELVRAVFEGLRNDPSIKVIFRASPLLTWEYFERKYGFRVQEVPHFKVSRGVSVLEDIRRAGVVMYWGTTVAMEALALGRPILHFDHGSRLSFDPLFGCPNLKWTVRRGEPLRPILDGMFDLSDEEFAGRFKFARRYMEHYFHPITPEAMASFME